MSESQTSLNAYANVDPWDMLNNFCFYVYAQKSLFTGFFTFSPPKPVALEFIEWFPAQKLRRKPSTERVTRYN